RLQLEPHLAVVGQPQPAVGAGDDGGGRALGQRAGGQQVGGEVDARRQAGRGGGAGGVVHGLVERLGRGSRGAAQRGLGDRGAAGQHGDRGAEGKDLSGRSGPESSHRAQVVRAVLDK